MNVAAESLRSAGQAGFDRVFMARALQLAGRAVGISDPNPAVGAVVVSDGRVIGEGWTQAAGREHAEIKALAQAEADRADAQSGLTVYVSLEPCSHHGRTPPCVEALIEAGVTRVVVASLDPNPEVDGAGIAQLRDSGIVVECGLLGAQAEEINPGFFKRMRTGLPWVRIKSAQSLDGRIALRSGESQWISCEASRQDVQRWRARSSAILTGVGTVLKDDPSMTVRLEGVQRQPLRVIVDTTFRTPADSRILSQPGQVIVAGDRAGAAQCDLADAGAEIIGLPRQQHADSGVDLLVLLTTLAEREINEVQVEAGARLCGALLREHLVDEVLIYQAPVLLGEGGPAAFELGPLDDMTQRVKFTVLESRAVGMDWRFRLRPCAMHAPLAD